VLVVDKPKGPTSFDVVRRVRQVFGERRVGHAGTLDPMATGVLPVCLGEATKLVPFLQAGEKVYEAEARLGVSTDTQDATGQVVSERDPRGVTREAIAMALARFQGRILQIPPMHSAIRVEGRRLYELAREGVEVEREAREVEVHEAALLAFEPPVVRFRVRCGKGTYIRAIANDLGEALGVGAHLTALRRTRVGASTVALAVPLAALAPTLTLTSPADALAHLPSLTLDEAQALAVTRGQGYAVERFAAPEGLLVRFLKPDGSLLAVAERRDGQLRLCRVFS
jgi:tRNA pseudouridine55 synthase